MSESKLVGSPGDPSHIKICRLEEEILQLRSQNELLTLKISDLETRHCKLEKVVSSLLAVKQSSISSVDTVKAIKTPKRSTRRVKEIREQNNTKSSSDVKHDPTISTTMESNTVPIRLSHDKRLIQRNSSVKAVSQCQTNISVDQLSTGLQDLSLVSYERKSPSKLETATSIILKSMNLKYDDEYELRSLPYKRYDFFVVKYNLLIEVDGRQHFVTDPNGDFVTTDEELHKGQENDILKTQHAIDNEYRILRIHHQCFDPSNDHKSVRKLIKSAFTRRTEPLMLSNIKEYIWLIKGVQINKTCIKCNIKKDRKNFPTRNIGWSRTCKDCHLPSKVM
jgi:very-short-patch-repair endonuclease